MAITITGTYYICALLEESYLDLEQRFHECFDSEDYQPGMEVYLITPMKSIVADMRSEGSCALTPYMHDAAAWLQNWDTKIPEEGGHPIFHIEDRRVVIGGLRCGDPATEEALLQW